MWWRTAHPVAFFLCLVNRWADLKHFAGILKGVFLIFMITNWNNTETGHPNDFKFPESADLSALCENQGGPAGRPLICFTLVIADFSNFDRFVLGT